MKNNTPKEIWDKLKKCKNIAMTLHIMPDGDSLGACAAMKYVLERDFNCKVTLVSYDNISKNYLSFKFSKEVKFGEDITDLDLQSFDALLLIDLSTVDRISGKLKEKFKLPENILTINIDHHDTNAYFGDLNYNDPEAPSACSTLIELLKEGNIKFDEELSTRLLTGLCSDTGIFRNSQSPLRALEEGVFLLKNKARRNEVIKNIALNEPLKMKKYYGTILNNLKINKEKKLGYSSITFEEIKKLDLNTSEIRHGISKIKDIEDLDFVFTLAELDDSIKGSFRAKDNVDVSLFAKALGGGGHQPAAGFQLQKMSLDQAEKIVLDTIDKVGIHKF